MGSADFIEAQHALITVYAPIIYFWIVLFLVATVILALWVIIIQILRRRL